MITWHQLSRETSGVSTIMATQEEKQALLGPSTPPVNPASSLPASAPEYEEPPPYTEGPAEPCKLCLKQLKTMVLFSLCTCTHSFSSLISFSLSHPPLSSLLPLPLLSCRHESAYWARWFRSSSTTVPSFTRPASLCPVPNVSNRWSMYRRGQPAVSSSVLTVRRPPWVYHRNCHVVCPSDVCVCVYVCVCVCVCVCSWWVSRLDLFLIDPDWSVCLLFLSQSVVNLISWKCDMLVTIWYLLYTHTHTHTLLMKAHTSCNGLLVLLGPLNGRIDFLVMRIVYWNRKYHISLLTYSLRLHWGAMVIKVALLNTVKDWRL